MARSVVVKGVESPERLLDETALFLHRVVSDLPPEKQSMLDRLISKPDMSGRRRSSTTQSKDVFRSVAMACWPDAAISISMSS